jgi:glycosyltransferase involved in cell wall biosynthesis
MVRYSILIPQRDRADELRRQLPALYAVLGELSEPFEIVVIDDGSTLANLRLIEKLHAENHGVRVLRLDRSCGMSVALTAGIRAARGEIIVAIEAGEAYPPTQIRTLVEWLERADLVLGRRRRTGFAKLGQRIARLPRWLLLGLDSHDPDCLFWTARREALADLALEPGMAHYLAALVARRGFRVCETYVDHQGPRHRLQDAKPHLFDLIVAWWRCRRWREAAVSESNPAIAEHPALRVVGVDATLAVPHSSITILPQAKSA